jgi:hypothetical protein
MQFIAWLRNAAVLAMTVLPMTCLAQAKPCPPSTLTVAGGTSSAMDCSPAGTLASQYPGDVGMANDPDVIWSENFEAGSVAAIVGRYSDVNNQAGMSLAANVPAKSRGAASLRLLSSGTGAHATDLFKNFGAGYEEFYVRYYVKYQKGGPWHHTGLWFGGYNPAANWASPQAGLKPSGSDRFSIAVEPVESGSNVRLDYYNYWMGMHSWMASPSGTTAYYGNSLLQDGTVRAPDDAWICVEVHAKLNQDLASGAGGELEVWLNDASKQRLTSTAPLGYWVRDKFCPATSTGTQCTQYRTASSTLAPLDMRFRSVSALKLNYIWLQNYISEGGSGSVWFDDLVVAKRRVGCLL